MKAELEILKERETSHGVVELRSDNILAFRPDLTSFKEYDLQVLEDLLEVFIEISDGIPRPYLCDNRHITGIINRDEQAYINEHFESFATRAAMITHSNLIRVLLNGYNSIFKPKVELKLFGSEKDAVKWLLMN